MRKNSQKNIALTWMAPVANENIVERLAQNCRVYKILIFISHSGAETVSLSRKAQLELIPQKWCKNSNNFEPELEKKNLIMVP